MILSDLIQKQRFEQLLLSQLSKTDVKKLTENYTLPFKELMAYYRCAMMEISTKFNVLDEELSLRYDRNPIESIKTRLKSPESIIEKLSRKKLPITVDSIEQNIYDIAGIRVICSFPSDIYMLSQAFLKQDDITLISRKDYIENPKENGYRSLHLIVETPIFLHYRKKLMKAEVQFRTISMDWWASLEHKIRYKKDYTIDNDTSLELLACAEIGAELDRRMEGIHKKVESGNKSK